MSTTNKNRIFSIAQWILIIVLLCICFYFYKKSTNVEKEYIKVEQTETSYTKEYQTERIKELEKENKNLYDSIKNIKNIENALEIRYIYKYNTDTVYVDKTIDSKKDSLYQYSYDNDTIKYNLSIMAEGLKWHNTKFELHDKFTIVNTLDDDRATTTITHSPNVKIEDVTTWRKKKSFKDNFFFGPSVGVGYGTFTGKVDIFVGMSAGYKF